MATHTSFSEKVGFLGPLLLDDPVSVLPEKAQTAAKEALLDLTIPTKKHEDWKYINLKGLQKKAFQLAPGANISDLTPFQIKGLESDVLVFVNGRYKEKWSSLQHNLEVIHITPLSQLSSSQEATVASYMGSLSEPSDIFAATNAASAQEGTFVHIPKGKTAVAPLHIIQIFVGEGIPNASQARNLIIAEEHSEAKIIESFYTVGTASYFQNQVNEVFVGQAARLDYIILEETSQQTSHINTTYVQQAKDSLFNIFTLTFGGELVRNNLIIKLQGEHTETHLLGTYLLDGVQQVDNFTQVHHMEPNCFSNELYKGIIDEQASAAFTGRINVYIDAQKTNAYQSNRNILLSDTANMYTKPQLEIYADDVKCSHGATTGRIDEEALFYLRARGIPEREARKMMIHAFTMEVAGVISLQSVVDHVENLIRAKF